MQERVWYLDAELRLVASTAGCGFVIACGESEWWYWYEEGQIPPEGLGYPDLIASGAFADLSGGRERPVNYELQGEKEPGIFTLEVRHVSSFSEAHVENATYKYHAGRLLPDSRWTVVEYTRGKDLHGADLLALPTPPAEAIPGDGIMFPGEDEDTFELGVTHREVAEFAFPDVTKEQGPCVVTYRIQLDQSGAGGIITPSFLSPETLAVASVSAAQGAELHEQEVRVKRDPVDGSTFLERGPARTGQARTTCEEVESSPWPSRNITQAFDLVRSLGSEHNLSRFYYSSDKMLAWQDPEIGLQTYRFVFSVPDDVGFRDNFEYMVRATKEVPLVQALVDPENNPFQSTHP